MTFMDSLASNPTSGIANQPPQEDVMSLVNKLKDRDMQDYRDKANFNADLSIRQEARMRNLYDPSKVNQQNTVMGSTTPSPFGNIDSPIKGNDPLSELSPKDKLNYGLQKDELSQKGKFGQEALDIKNSQEKLNQQKSDQINELKQTESDNKLDLANQKLQLAQQALLDKSKTTEEQLQARKDYQAAVEERHKLEMESKQKQFDTVNEQHKQQIADMEKKLKDSQNKITTTNVSPDGNNKTTTTKTGDAAKYAPKRESNGTYTVYFPDGSQHSIPGDKIDDWNQNHQPVVDKALGGGGEE